MIIVVTRSPLFYLFSIFFKVRQQVHSRSELAKHQLDLEDIVTEEAIPDLGYISMLFASKYVLI